MQVNLVGQLLKRGKVLVIGAFWEIAKRVVGHRSCQVVVRQDFVSRWSDGLVQLRELRGYAVDAFPL